MKEARAFPASINQSHCGNDSLINEVLNFYFQCCSILVDCDGLAIAASTLANGGVNPLTNEQVLSRDTVKRCLSLMYSCGMYDYSGEFAFRVGLPAKSGVAGGIMVVVPNLLGLATFSPKLDQYGNSVKGREYLLKLVQKYRFHNFDILPHDSVGSTDEAVQGGFQSYVKDSSTIAGNDNTAGGGASNTGNTTGPTSATGASSNQKHHSQRESGSSPHHSQPHSNNNSNNAQPQVAASHLISLASIGDAVSLRRLRLGGLTDFCVFDSDCRTPLHLASANGHLNVVTFLLFTGHDVSVKDRWGRTPIDDAKSNGWGNVEQVLVKAMVKRNSPGYAGMGGGTVSDSVIGNDRRRSSGATGLLSRFSPEKRGSGTPEKKASQE